MKRLRKKRVRESRMKLEANSEKLRQLDWKEVVEDYPDSGFVEGHLLLPNFLRGQVRVENDRILFPAVE